MANTITKQTIADGELNLVVKVHLTSDGSEETATAIIVAGDYSPAFTNCRLLRLYVAIASASLQGKLLWDAAADVPIVALAPNSFYDADWSEFGGLPNDAGAGKTGNVLLTTLGLASGDELTLILYLRKV
mgnify:CR=1 FL=1